MIKVARLAVVLILLFGAAANALAEIPEAARSDPRFAMGYLVVTHYPGVTNDGTGDSTAGLQQAIDDASRERMTVLFPSGEYLISDSLKCYKYQLWSEARAATAVKPKHATEHPEGTFILFGENSDGARPVIRLSSEAKGFDDPEQPRPMLVFRNFRATTKAGARPKEPQNPLEPPKDFEDATAMLFGVKLCNIDFDCANRPGAIGVSIPTAQVSAAVNIRVNAEGAYAGFHGLPGRNSISANLEVVGGQYGLYLKGNLAGAIVSGLKLTNQTVNAIMCTDFCPLAVVGFDINTAKGPALTLTSNDRMANGSMTLVDGRVEVASGETAIDNSVGKALYLRNVFVKGGQSPLKSGEQDPLKAAGEWTRIAEYAYTDQMAPAEDDPPYEVGDHIYRMFSLIDGKLSSDPQPVIALDQAAPPEDLVTRHLWKELPLYTGQSNETIIVTSAEYGATPNDETDDHAAIQKAIDDASAAGHGRVFLPSGTYLIGKTLELKANTILIGAGWNLSEITAHPDWIPAEGERAVLVQTVDDAKATTTIGFLGLRTPVEKFDLTEEEMLKPLPMEKIPARHRFTNLQWRAGRNSMILCIQTYRTNIPVEMAQLPGPMIHFTGNGGGRHYCIQPRPQASHRDFRGVLVEGTHEPLTIYGLNSEKSYIPKAKELPSSKANEWLDANSILTNVEVVNASNVRIFSMKREGSGASLIIRDSNNVALFATGAMRNPSHRRLGGYVQVLGNSQNVLVSTAIVQQVKSLEAKDGESEEPLLREAIEGQEEIAVIWPEGLSVYKRGNLEDDAFVW